jgi:hypothetical protein
MVSTIEPMPDDDLVTSRWHAMLSGDDPAPRGVRRIWQRLPAAPRCKICASPTQGVGGAVARLLWHRPARVNRVRGAAASIAISRG